MKITFDEITSKKEWIHHELLNSLDGKAIDNATKDRYYDIKLLVNGVEYEPKYLTDLFNNIEKYVDAEANKIITDRLYDAKLQTDKLLNVVNSAIENIVYKFNVDIDVD